ncbi:MAG: AI-2E family transporter [Pseudomonadota bacterium]
MSQATSQATQHIGRWLVVLALVLAVLYALSDVVAPFFAALAIAYLLDPLADRLEALRVPRVIAAFGILVGLVMIIGLLGWLLFPQLVRELSELIATIPTYTSRLDRLLAEQTSGDLQAQIKLLARQYTGEILSWLNKAIQALVRSSLTVFDFLAILVITPIVVFYLLCDWDRLVAGIDGYLPKKHQPLIREIANETHKTLGAFVRGQLLVCLVLAIGYAAALKIVGLPFGMVVGLFSGLLSFIPFIGSLGGLIIGTGIAMVSFDYWVMWLVVAVIFMVGQFIEGNILTPRLMGQAVRLHPVWIIFALLAGGQLLGFTGFLIAVPAAAVIGVLVRRGLLAYQNSDLYRL